MQFRDLLKLHDIRTIQTHNKYAVLLRASEDMDFPEWNERADPLRWAILWDEKEIAGHKIKTQSGRALDGEPRYILRADPDTGELVPYLNICEWRQSYFYESLEMALAELEAMEDEGEQQNTTTHSEPLHAYYSRV